MHPARSIILFTTLSGLGFGLLVWLGIDAQAPTGWVGFIFFVIAYALDFNLIIAVFVVSCVYYNFPLFGVNFC